MPALIGLGLSIAVLAVLAVWSFLGPLAPYGVQIWAAFVAWACFFQTGGKTQGFLNTVVCMIYGAVIGAVTVTGAGHLGTLGAFAVPVAVGIGAFVLVASAYIPPLATIPASFYGFCVFAGLLLLKQPAMAPFDVVPPIVISIVLGGIFGFASEMGAGMLTKKA